MSARTCGFDSRPRHHRQISGSSANGDNLNHVHRALVAQWIERSPAKAEVVGSNPAKRAITPWLVKNIQNPDFHVSNLEFRPRESAVRLQNPKHPSRIERRSDRAFAFTDLTAPVFPEGAQRHPAKSTANITYVFPTTFPQPNQSALPFAMPTIHKRAGHAVLSFSIADFAFPLQIPVPQPNVTSASLAITAWKYYLFDHGWTAPNLLMTEIRSIGEHAGWHRIVQRVETVVTLARMN